ncbi:MAG TPA: carboxypeptidase-like regulatory domain-containing protein, partial [Terriglobia bacterium]|nr:carboxypeptidase-like regulatory domain-containing protein [Terriglobia bacterium]
MKPVLHRLVVFFAALALATSLFGQVTSSITGTVTDSSGAVVPGAAVTISDLSEGVTRHEVTNSAGSYLVPGLPAGTYTLVVEAKGFDTYRATGIILQAAEKIRANATLHVGQVSTQVTVQGQNIGQVHTENAQLGGTIVGRQVTQLVLNGRDYTQLVALMPGVTNMSGQDTGEVGVVGSPAYSVNGGRVEYNNWEVDGVGDMDQGSGGSTNNVFPSPDAIGEERLLTSNYGAQYGGDSSATLITAIKQGTSQFHGDAYEFNRNSAFNARNFFEIPDRGFENKNDFGYTFGGPFYIPGHYNTDKTKTFFFWSQEWHRDIVPNTYNVQVPSVQERQGNFSDLCPGTDCPTNPATGSPFPGNIVPIAPQAQAMLSLIPAPNFGSGAQSFYLASPSYPTHWFENLVRVDQNITPKVRLMVHYIHDSWSTVNPGTLWSEASFPTINTDFSGPATHFVTQLTATASPTLLNEFIFGYTADHIILNNVGAWQLPANFAMSGLFANGFGGKIPGIANICCNAEDAGGGGFGEDPGFINPANPKYNANPIYTFRDIVTKIAGDHNLTFGGDFIAYQKNEQYGGTPNTNGELTFSTSSTVTTGNAFADFLTGRISQYQQLNSELKYYNRYKTFSPYLQDDWHVTHHLTLNLGFRAELYGTFYDKNRDESSFDPLAYNPADAPEIDVTGSITGVAGALVPGVGNEFDGLTTCGLNGVPASCVKGHVFNPAPRFGFAWDPTGRGKTAIRGGYGIFYDHMNGNEVNTESLEGTPPSALSPSVFNIVGYQNVGGTALSFPLNITALEGQIFWPMVQQWNLDVEHNFGDNTVVRVAYVGSKGTHLTDQRDLNQLSPVPLSQDPFGPGQPITSANCGSTLTGPNGLAVSGQAAINLGVACGNDANPYRPFTGYGDITLLESQANSDYNSLQVYATKAIGRVNFSLAYTYSHALDDSSDRYDGVFVNSYDLERSYASSNYDETNNVSASYVWSLPSLQHSNVLLRDTLGGWEVSGIGTYHTGNPFSVSNGGVAGVAG